jgi:hypothetical protein
MRRHLQHVEEHLTSDTDEPEIKDKVAPSPPAKRMARGSGNGATTPRRN